MGYCIVHNPLLLQPLRHWSTFIFRKYEHLAVGSSGRGLTRSRGHPHFVVASPSPFVSLLYHNLDNLSRGIFEKSQPFSKTFSLLLLRCCGASDFGGIVSQRTRSTCRVVFPLDIIIITHLHPKVKYYFKKFSVSIR